MGWNPGTWIIITMQTLPRMVADLQKSVPSATETIVAFHVPVTPRLSDLTYMLHIAA